MSTFRIFADRAEAARAMAQALQHYRGKQPLLLAIPRGAVPMARRIADDLGGDVDVVLVRKLGAPFSDEYAIGAIDESGWTYISPLAQAAGATASYIDGEKRRQLALLQERRARYTPFRHACDPGGRIAIVIDDGLATGATMIAALHAVRARQPARLVCAVPVAAPDSLAQVEPLADEVVCLHAPPDFSAVGQFYRRFDAVEDEEVIAILTGNANRA
jgi:putative phosphoribosyl transferase